LIHFTNLLDHFSFQKKVGCAITYDTQVRPSTGKKKKKRNFTQKDARHFSSAQKTVLGGKNTIFFRKKSLARIQNTIRKVKQRGYVKNKKTQQKTRWPWSECELFMPSSPGSNTQSG
jgi:hypothetical protein